MNGFELTDRLNQIVIEAYKRRARHLPANITEIVATIKGDLLRHLPSVPIEVIDDAISIEALNDDIHLSPAFFFSAVKKHYTPPRTPRMMDKEPHRRPDTEQDTINLLDCLAGLLAKGDTSRLYFNPWREYDYLRMRGQLSDDLSPYMQAAKNAVNVERVRDWKRPLQDWTGADLDDLNARARHLALTAWLQACNEQGRKPSDILAPLANETQYQYFRRTT